MTGYSVGASRTAWRMPALVTAASAGVLVLAALLGVHVFSSSEGPQAPAVGAPSGTAKSAVAATYANLPLRFETGAGGDGRYVARGAGYGVSLTGRHATLSLSGPSSRDAVIRMRLLGASAGPAASAHDRLAGTSNYLVGRDKSRWRTGVPGYGRVSYRSVYPGTDVVYYGRQGKLEYDFMVAPGADPRRIALGFSGADGMRLDRRGDLILETPAGSLRQHRPVAYQRVGTANRPVPARYDLRGDGRVGFTLGAYDHTRPLIIDPVLSYSTYFGATTAGEDSATDIAVDSAGNAYVTGTTTGSDFLTTEGAYDRVCDGCSPGASDVFITKLSPTGSVVYSTFLGGGGQEFGTGVAVRPGCAPSCSVYVAGSAASADFPVAGGVQASRNDAVDSFLSKLNAAGTALEYSTYLGGSTTFFFETDRPTAVAVDSAGNAYLSGTTNTLDFPTTASAHDRECGTVTPPAADCSGGDGYVAKFDPTKTGADSLVYSTYLGGSAGEDPSGIAVNSTGSAYVSGTTGSTNFPAGAAAAFQPAMAGVTDGYLAKLNPAGSALDYSTYLGGTGRDGASDVAVDGAGRAYISGDTQSVNFPTTSGAYQTVKRGSRDGYVAKFDPSAGGAASLMYSTMLGPFEAASADATFANEVAVDGSGGAYVTGDTSSDDFPAVGAFQPTFQEGGRDAFVAKLNPAGSALDYSTYLGGTGFDSAAGIAVASGCAAACRAHVAGLTQSLDFPTQNPVQAQRRGGGDPFIAALDPAPTVRPTIRGLSVAHGSALGGTTVTIDGVDFTAATAVEFGGVAAASFSVDSSGRRITAVTPARAAGIVDVTVTSPAGTSPASPKARFLFGQGRWRDTDALETARSGHTATLLPNGKVLVAGGGTFGERQNRGAPLASAELYDPKTGEWSPTGALNTARSHHTATLLTGPACQGPTPPTWCGKVLIAGGGSVSVVIPGQQTRRYPIASAELYDPAAAGGQGAFTAIPAPMGRARSQHTATRLPDGRVLLAAGCNTADQVFTQPGQLFNCSASEVYQPDASAEIFDPATSSFSSAGSPGFGRVGHSATLLPSGKVLFVGGTTKSEHSAGGGTFGVLVTVAPAQLFDPAGNTWTPTAGQPADPRADHVAPLLPSGKVLIAGGTDAHIYSTFKGSAELYDPQTDAFTNATPQLRTHSAVPPALLPSGDVLVPSGSGDFLEYPPPLTLELSELFDPSANSGRGIWRPALPTLLARDPGRTPHHTVTLLSSRPETFAADRGVCGSNCGKVLVAGGEAGNSNFSPQMTAGSELYTPAPTITSVSPGDGPAAGGTAVTIGGTGFTHGVTEVRFGGVPAQSFGVDSFSRIVAVAPPGSAGESVPVTVLNDGGRGQSTDRFRYAVPDGPAPDPPGAQLDGPPAGPGAGPGRDTVRPVVSGLSILDREFSIGSLLPRLASAARVGTRIRFRLSEPATARLVFARARPGRRVGSSCRAPSRRSRRGRPCTRYVAVRPSVLVRGARAGVNSVRFQGRLTASRRLRPGRYRVTVTATDAAGNRSRSRSTAFTLLRARSRGSR